MRQSLRRSAGGVAQALILEVVELMVDNIAMDPRLLEPVQRLIRNLEPAMLRLALVDPRFFSDKGHPGRALLEEAMPRFCGLEAEMLASLSLVEQETLSALMAKVVLAMFDGSTDEPSTGSSRSPS